MNARQILGQLSQKLSSTIGHAGSGGGGGGIINGNVANRIPLLEFIQLYRSILATLSQYGLEQEIENDDLARRHQQDTPIDLMTPILNYLPSTDDSLLIPYLAKIVWNYIHHPYLKISVLVNLLDKICLLQLINLPHKKLTYVEHYFIMNSNKQDELTNYVSFLSSACQFIKQYKTMVSTWTNDLADLNNLLEISTQESHALLRKLLFEINPEILGYIILVPNSIIVNYIKRMVLYEQQPQSLQNSLKFILQVLDHSGTNTLTPAVCHRLHCCVEVLQKSNKHEVITCYNNLNPKLSLCMTLNYLIYIISKQIMKNLFMDEFPTCMTNHFLLFSLPPLPKPMEFMQPENKNDLEKVLYKMEINDSYKIFLVIQHKILSVIKTYMEDECLEIETMNQHIVCSSQLTEKLILSYHEIFIVSLLSPLILCHKFDSQMIKLHQSNTVHECIHKLLNTKYNTVKANQIWITLINTVNDICYSDLRYIKLFINMFQFQLDNNSTSILSDDLINSGLCFFIETFCPDHKWFNEIPDDENECMVSLDDYKFLYPELLNNKQRYTSN